jgi:hypothetical protein
LNFAEEERQVSQKQKKEERNKEERKAKMAPEKTANGTDSVPAPDGAADARARLESSVAGLSLSSRAVHADDGIQAHRAVAPAMHVSTTFRYSDDPEQLKSWDNIDVSALTLTIL